MDETTIATEQATEQQQLAELKAKVESLSVISEEEGGGPTDSTTPVDLEKTPEFEAWKQGKLQGALDYLRDTWGIEITAEKLLMQDEYLGFPDPKNRRTHAMVWSYNYVNPVTGEVIINPATGRRMLYKVWREIGSAPEPVEPTIE